MECIFHLESEVLPCVQLKSLLISLCLAGPADWRQGTPRSLWPALLNSFYFFQHPFSSEINEHDLRRYTEKNYSMNLEPYTPFQKNDGFYSPSKSLSPSLSLSLHTHTHTHLFHIWIGLLALFILYFFPLSFQILRRLYQTKFSLYLSLLTSSCFWGIIFSNRNGIQNDFRKSLKDAQPHLISYHFQI